VEAHPFRLLRNLGRTREIMVVLLNHGFGDVVDRVGLSTYWRRMKRLVSRKPLDAPPKLKAVERIRLSLEALGPTYIKFGQVMSTRPDLIPADMIAELARLQEHVPPFPAEEAVEILECELGAPISRLFAAFDRVPLAAGSLAQVHKAVHHDGTALAIKIRRPNAERNIERDLSLMVELAALAEKHIAESKVFDPCGLVAHFARTIRRELNFAREARTMEDFRRMFRNDATLRIPQVYPDLVTESVLTMEFVDGYRIDDYMQLGCPPCPPAEVARNGARIFMKMAIEFGIFHGDPHPGNLRITPDGTVCLLDFGMVGILEEHTREQIVDLLQAVNSRDVEAAVNVVLTMGEPFRPVEYGLLRIDIQDFLANYYGVELERMHVAQMLTDFVGILSAHGLRCPPSVMLLVRVLVTLDGVGRRLDPCFNLATELQPFIERLVRDRYRPGRIAHRLAVDGQRLLGAARELPIQINSTLKKLNNDSLQVHLDHQGLDHFTLEVERSSNRLVVGMIVAALILASALILPRGGTNTFWFSLPVYLLSSLLGVWLIYGIFRSGRL
jgi:ubiquinone biosynthesis protein